MDVFLSRVGIHKKSSHLQDNAVFLTDVQKRAIKNAVRASPLKPGALVRRNLNNL